MVSDLTFAAHNCTSTTEITYTRCLGCRLQFVRTNLHLHWWFGWRQSDTCESQQDQELTKSKRSKQMLQLQYSCQGNKSNTTTPITPVIFSTLQSVHLTVLWFSSQSLSAVLYFNELILLVYFTSLYQRKWVSLINSLIHTIYIAVFQYIYK